MDRSIGKDCRASVLDLFLFLFSFFLCIVIWRLTRAIRVLLVHNAIIRMFFYNICCCSQDFRICKIWIKVNPISIIYYICILKQILNNKPYFAWLKKNNYFLLELCIHGVHITLEFKLRRILLLFVNLLFDCVSIQIIENFE